MALIETEEQAMRLARHIASDIKLYNEEKIIQGIQQDNLFEALKDELDEGLQHYKSRISPALYEKTNFYFRAVVDIIMKQMAHIKSDIW